VRTDAAGRRATFVRFIIRIIQWKIFLMLDD